MPQFDSQFSRPNFQIKSNQIRLIFAITFKHILIGRISIVQLPQRGTTTEAIKQLLQLYNNY